MQTLDMVQVELPELSKSDELLASLIRAGSGGYPGTGVYGVCGAGVGK